MADTISVATLASVTSYSELIWYANAPDPSSPQTPPTSPPGIAVLHSQLTVVPAYANSELGSLVIRYGWQDVGQLIPTPSATFSASSPELIAVDPFGLSRRFVPGSRGGRERRWRARDRIRSVRMSPSCNSRDPSGRPAGADSSAEWAVRTLLSMSRGKSVSGEVLGSAAMLSGLGWAGVRAWAKIPVDLSAER